METIQAKLERHLLQSVPSVVEHLSCLVGMAHEGLVRLSFSETPEEFLQTVKEAKAIFDRIADVATEMP